MLDLLVLSMLDRGDRYGYDISEALARRIELADGTVYPLLRKLRSDGYVTTYLSEESGGPPRKYYSITKSGRELYRRERAEWLGFIRTVEELLGSEESHE
ncbi:MAG TPA: PadR family transcriptional regulator [Clostridia bacterium]|nr:PadR family transcriptional regulator [Clostridia bacterium]HOS17853.1 PadR family transcriptional regulator [Clostridia bacterium]HPK16146.1 PadR family transcriptional regulator [Clostridia bacterium]